MSCHYTRIFKNILIFLSESGLKDSQDSQDSQDYESGFGDPSHKNSNQESGFGDPSYRFHLM